MRIIIVGLLMFSLASAHAGFVREKADAEFVKKEMEVLRPNMPFTTYIPSSYKNLPPTSGKTFAVSPLLSTFKRGTLLLVSKDDPASRTLVMDMNKDSDFSNDTRLQLPRGSKTARQELDMGNGTSMHIEMRVMDFGDSMMSSPNAPPALFFTFKPTDWYRGKVMLRGKAYSAVLIDADLNGIEMDKADQIALDLDGNGKFETVQGEVVPLGQTLWLEDIWKARIDYATSDIILDAVPGERGELRLAGNLFADRKDLRYQIRLIGGSVGNLSITTRKREIGLPEGLYFPQSVLVQTKISETLLGQVTFNRSSNGNGWLKIAPDEPVSLSLSAPKGLEVVVTEGAGILSIGKNILGSGAMVVKNVSYVGTSGMDTASATPGEVIVAVGKRVDISGVDEMIGPPAVQVFAVGETEPIGGGTMEYG